MPTGKQIAASFALLVSSAFAHAQNGQLAETTPALKVYSTTKTVQFCAMHVNCSGRGVLPDEVEIIPDIDPTVQVIGAWIYPSNANAASSLWIKDFHVYAFPSATKANTVVVKFIPSAAGEILAEYTVVIKYLKGSSASAIRLTQ